MPEPAAHSQPPRRCRRRPSATPSAGPPREAFAKPTTPPPPGAANMPAGPVPHAWRPRPSDAKLALTKQTRAGRPPLAESAGRQPASPFALPCRRVKARAQLGSCGGKSAARDGVGGRVAPGPWLMEIARLKTSRPPPSLPPPAVLKRASVRIGQRLRSLPWLATAAAAARAGKAREGWAAGGERNGRGTRRAGLGVPEGDWAGPGLGIRRCR